MKVFDCFQRRRDGFSLLDLLFVIAAIIFLLLLISPVTRMSGNAARRTVCANNLRQIAIAAHAFHDAHEHFPAAMGRLENSDSSHVGLGRHSGLILLLPYLEEQPLWEEISHPVVIDGVQHFPAMGPAPWNRDYEPWKKQVSIFRCPTAFGVTSEFGQTNYAFSIGDQARRIHQPPQLRGAFGCGLISKLSDIGDGTSNTIAFAEIGTQFERSTSGQYAIDQAQSILDRPSDCLNFTNATSSFTYKTNIVLSKLGRGGCWADGSAGPSLVNTILPPNSPSASIGSANMSDGFYTAGSQHPGMANVSFADGSVHVIRNDIDSGNLDSPTLTFEQLSQTEPRESPYGVWGALGTSNGADAALDY